MSNSKAEATDYEDLPSESLIQAINNPLILQCILSNVNGTSIKRLRLVSKSWNELILSFPDPKIYLVLNNDKIQDIKDPQVFINFSNSMDKRLSRNIGLLSSVDLNKHPYTSNTVLPDSRHDWRLESVGYVNMVHCIQKFSTTIHTIDLSETYVKIDFVRVLHQLLQNYCPNLVKFRLHVDSIPESTDPRNRPPHISQTWKDVDFSSTQHNGGQIPIKKKLAIIDVKLFEGQTQPPRVIDGPLHELYASLIKAAPNLIGLRQKIVAFPDCSTLAQIKSFNFRLSFFDYDFKTTRGLLQVNFNLEGLACMLRQMSDSLEYLKLQAHHKQCKRMSGRDWCSCPTALGFVMPHMKNLKIFHCSDTDIFFRDANTFYNIALPHSGDKLRHVEIGRQISRNSIGIYQFVTAVCDISLRSNKCVSKNLKSLSINGISSALGTLVTLTASFPELKTLLINKKFGVRKYQSDDLGDCHLSCLMAEALHVANFMELENFDFTLPFPEDFVTFASVLEHYIPLFQSGKLKRLCMVGTRSGMYMGDAEDENVMQQLKNAFLAMRNMESVEIINSSITLPASVGQELFGFIMRQSLPIQFKLAK